MLLAGDNTATSSFVGFDPSAWIFGVTAAKGQQASPSRKKNEKLLSGHAATERVPKPQHFAAISSQLDSTLHFKLIISCVFI